MTSPTFSSSLNPKLIRLPGFMNVTNNHQLWTRCDPLQEKLKLRKCCGKHGSEGVQSDARILSSDTCGNSDSYTMMIWYNIIKNNMV